MRRTHAAPRPGGEHPRASGSPLPASLASLASFAALTALLLAPAVPAAAQDPVEAPPEQEVREGHQVVRGNTLWELAESFYGNPYLWPRIYEANRDRIDDPHWIYPGQVLRIPGEDGELVEVVVAPGGERDMRGAAPVQERPDGRTVFYPGTRDRTGTIMPRTAFYPRTTEIDLVVDADERSRLAISHSSFYSAEWLSRLEEEEIPEHMGRVQGFAGAAGDRSERVTARPFESVRIDLAPGAPVSVGDLLQTFRVSRTEDVGTILKPTGVVVVSEVVPAGAMARVSASFDQVRIGDLIRHAPVFPLRRGMEARSLDDGFRTRVVAVGEVHALQSLRDVLILDAGSDAGVRVGDEFVVVVGDEEGWGGVVEGTARVVGVRPGSSSARIIEVNSPVFEVGTVLRRSARMP